MENYGGERVVPGTSASSLYQNSPLALDQRDILIDFTLKETNLHPSKANGNIDAVMVGTHQTIRSEDQAHLFPTRDMRLQSLSSSFGKTEKLNSEIPPVNFHRNINHVKAKDDPTQFVTIHKGDREIVLEESQVKEIVTALMLRKDVKAQMIQQKDLEEFPCLDPSKRLPFPVEFPEEVNSATFHYEQKPTFQDERKAKGPSLFMPSRNIMPEKFQMKNKYPSSFVDQSNFDKNVFSFFSKGQEQFVEKSELSPFAALQKQTRLKNKLATFTFLDDCGLKRTSPLVSIPEQSRVIRNAQSPSSFIQGQIHNTKSCPISDDSRADSTSSSFIFNDRYIQMKNLSTFAEDPDQHVRMNESFSPLTHVQRAELVRLNTSTPLAITPEQIQIDSGPSSFSLGQVNSHIKNGSSSFPVPQEHVHIKNYDLEKTNQSFVYAQERILVNHDTPSFPQNHIRMKSLSPPPYNAQQSAEIKNPLFHLDSHIPVQMKLTPTPVSTSLSNGHVNKNTSPSFSVVQVEFPVKNVYSMLENSERCLTEEFLGSKKNFQSPSLSRTIVQDPSIIKDTLASFSMDKMKIQKRNPIKNTVLCQSVSRLKDIIQVPLHTVMHNNGKVKNVSTVHQDTLNMPTEIREDNSLLQIQRNSILETHLRGVQLPDHSLPEQIIDSRTFHPASKIDRHSPSRSTSGSHMEFNAIRTKEETSNQHSVIAQVGMKCKVCNLCQSFYYDNGFLPVEDSCPLCMYHAKEGMKCVCHHTAIKEDTCTCVEKKYRCAFCSETFPTILQLQKHTFTHITSNNPDNDCLGLAKESESKLLHFCPVCNLSFPTNIALDLHKQSHKDNYCKNCNCTFQYLNEARHSCDSRFTCNLCGAGFASNYNLKMHVLKHFGNLPYKCGECSKSFAKPSELSKHSLAHCGERPYLCDECNMSFSSSTSLRNHKNTHSGRKPHSCHVCNKSFTRRADVRRHMLIHTGARPHACSVCGLAFADASNMRKHLQTHSKPQQGPDIKTYHCTYCGKMFARPSELKRHFFTHTNTRPYSCHICGLAFTDSSNLKKHIQTHERATEHTCPQCDTNFQSFEELERHVSSSHGTKRFDPTIGHTCQTCGAAFTQLVDLQDHVLSHGASPTYKCEICSKTFCEQLFLERHLLTHTESRPYTCSDCLKSFKSLSHLRSHILTHTGEKTHVCLTCNKSFLKKSSLLRHKGIHTREKVVIF